MTDKKEVVNDLESQLSDYDQYKGMIDGYVDSFVTDMFNQGMIDEVDIKELKKYFTNPDMYQKEMQNITEYFYTSNGEVFQLF
ncbi:MAG: hypothetical protein WD512_05405, partial [Candidatus Paceibacterota bacterium]